MEETNERRRNPRIEIRWPVTILTDYGSVQGEALNINPGGIYMYCADPLPLDQNYQMSVSPPNHKAMAVKGKVIWSGLYGLDEKQNTFGIGVCFLEITAEDRHFLEEMMVMDPVDGALKDKDD